jgi:copper resistance protein D
MAVGRRAGRGREQTTPWWEGEPPVVPISRARGGSGRPPATPGPSRAPAPNAPRRTGGLAPVVPLRPVGAGPATAPVTSIGGVASPASTLVAWSDTLQLTRVHTGRQRAVRHPPVPPARPAAPPRRRMAALGRGLAGGVGAVAALAVAWFVLVTLRFDAPVARRSLAVARLDAAVADGRTADHVLSVATWAGYVATTLVLGALAFRTVVRRAPRRLPVVAAAGAGVGAAAVSVALRAVEVTGGGLEAAADTDVLAHVVTSPFGGAMALRAAGLLLAAASLGGSQVGPGTGTRRVGRWLAGAGRLAGAGVLLASYLVIGHAQATDPVVVEVTALGVHIAAASAWFGGVAVLALDLRPRAAGHTGRRGRLPARAVARLSRMAEVMVVLVIVSGAVLAEGQDLFARPPWTTGYGQAFLAKLAFVAVVLVIGGYDRLRVVPAIAERDEAAARAHLRATCVVEALVIGLGVLLMTAAMTSGGF